MDALRSPSCLLRMRIVFTIILLRTSVSALEWGADHGDGIRFSRGSGDQPCTMCLGSDSCFTIDQDRCEYYVEATRILQERGFESGPQRFQPTLRAEVDSMLYGLAESVYASHPDKECIPFISKYTNCNKENICLGCKTCACDSTGQWNCTESQICAPETTRVTLNHRTLLSVLDNLDKGDMNTNRLKRSIEKLSRSIDKETTYNLLRWIYGAPLDIDKPHLTSDKHSNENNITNNAHMTESSDDDTSDDEQPTLATKKLLRFILHDPLHGNPVMNPEFDTSKNQIKRSAENENVGISLGNATNMEDDVEYEIKKEPLINQQDTLDESDDDPFVNFVKHMASLAEKFNNDDINAGSPDYESNNNTSKATNVQILTNNKEYYNDTIPLYLSVYPLPQMIEFVTKVFHSILPFHKTNVNYLDSVNINKYNAQNISDSEQNVYGMRSNKSKRSLSFVGKRDKDKVDDDIKYNSLYKHEINDSDENNLYQLSNPEIVEWLNDQHPLSYIHSNEREYTTNTITSDDNKGDDLVITANGSDFEHQITETDLTNQNQTGKQKTLQLLNDQHPYCQNYTATSVNSEINNENITVGRSLSLLTEQEISKWINDQHPISQSFMETSKDTVESTTYTVESAFESTTDYLIALKDVDVGVFKINQSHVRRKPPSDMISAKNIFYENELMEDKKPNVTDFEDNTETITKENVEYLTTTETEAVTEVFIDLLESAKTKIKVQGENNDYDNAVDLQKNYDATHTVEIQNTIDDDKTISSVNLMKRDVSQINEDLDEDIPLPSNTTELLKTTLSPYITHTIKYLIHGVLLPIKKLLINKNKEIDELFNIRNTLVNIIENSKSTLDLSLNDTNANRDMNSDYSVYKIETIPNFDLDLKKTSVDLLNQYISKLKTDVYEVIKDIAGIQKLHFKVPRDIKLLIKAMKQYVHKQGFHKKLKHKNVKNVRLFLSKSENDGDSTNIEDKIIKILELLDKDIFQDNVITSLSPVSAKIMKRIINNYYTDELAATGIRVHDPHYNLTNDLVSIGSKWKEITSNLNIDTTTSKLYKMKSLYQVLSSDIHKITDALFLINFARNRRMVPLEQHIGDTIITRINGDLENLYNQILETNRKNNEDALQESSLSFFKTLKQKKPKESFLKKLKKLMFNSKRGIVSHFGKVVPNPNVESVKELAGKRQETVELDRVFEYEDKMQRWKMNLASLRRKRSAKNDNNFKNRMNNILPKYLRGKLHSSMNNRSNTLRDVTKSKISPARNSKPYVKKSGTDTIKKIMIKTVDATKNETYLARDARPNVKRTGIYTKKKKINDKPKKINKKKAAFKTKEVYDKNGSQKQIRSKKAPMAILKQKFKNNKGRSR